MKTLFKTIGLMLLTLVVAASCQGKKNPGVSIPVESVLVVPESITLKEGDTKQLSVTILPENATDRSLIWTTSNSGVADVTGGVVTAKGEGIATVTAYASGSAVKGECEVAVLPRIPKGAVDLGLSVYWGSCNVGASKPEETGDYFAWGGVTPHEGNTFTWETYEWCNGSKTKLTRYNWDNTYGTSDNLSQLLPSDDAAAHKLKGEWRMPQAADFQELINRCTLKLTKQDGVSGALFTGPNGNSIFIPASGEYDEYGHRNETCIYLWSSTLNGNYPIKTQALKVMNDEAFKPMLTAIDRYNGIPVRGICPK